VATNQPIITNPALHINGKVEVSDGTGSCTTCHGSGDNPAPPRDLAGNTDTSFVTVGAHQAHLTASRISGPVACSACHVVPTSVASPGHVDHDPPATLKFSGAAVAYGATPSWDRTAMTCSATWCHGDGGSKFPAGTTGTTSQPVWTKGASQVYCGSCHAVPMGQDPLHPDPNHPKGQQLGDCYKCHSATVDPGGNIIVSGPPGARVSTHINGVVDVSITP
jgi:predicted CxxxxCH...CXXCH cytochrome family protein